MKKLTLLIAVSFFACKKDNVAPTENQTPKPTQTIYNYILTQTGMCTGSGCSQITIIQPNPYKQIIYNNVYNEYDSIKVRTNDTIWLSDNNYASHNVKLFLNKKLFLDTTTIEQKHLYFKIPVK